jgi:hypothetical protein
MKNFIVGFACGYGAKSTNFFGKAVPVLKQVTREGMENEFSAIPFIVGKNILKHLFKI